MKSLSKRIYASAAAIATAFTICCTAVTPYNSNFINNVYAAEAADIIDEQTGLHYVVNDGIVTVTGCEDTLTDVSVPAQLGGYPVKIIGEEAFERNNKLKTIVLAEGITTIEEGAFYGCRFLTSVDLPSTITYIGSYAFRVCTNLSDIEIPPLVTVINESAFENCALHTLIIPEGVTDIKDSAFGSNSELTSLYIPSTVREIGKSAFNGCRLLRTLNIPYGVERIGESAFESCDCLQTVILPESLLYIEKWAFSNCNSLKSVELPDSLISLGDLVFSYTYMTDFTIPDNVQYVGGYTYPADFEPEIVDGVKYIGNWVVGYDSKTLGDTINIREGTVGIADNSFDYGNIQKLILPSTIKYICPSAFYSSKISEIAVSDDNSEICVIDSVIYSKDMTRLIKYPDFKTDESFTIPDTVYEIDEKAFENCKNLISVTVPDSVYYIGNSAFSNCENITDLNLPEGVQYIGAGAFVNCDGLDKTFDIPDSVTSIGENAFGGSSASVTKYMGAEESQNEIKMVDDWIVSGGDFHPELMLTGNIRGIADGAFRDKTYTSVIMPDSVEYIGKYAFEGCTYIENLTMSERLISIDDYAFTNCYSLETPNIPDSVIHVGKHAFECCANAVEKVNGISYIDTWAVESDTSVTSADLRKGTIGIAESTFYTHTELTSAVLPEGLCFINESAFEFCLELTELTLPESLLTIDTAAFACCASLEEVTIPANTVYVDYAAFILCEALSKITFYNPECIIYPSADTIAEQAVIYGYSGSTAEEYAKAFNRSFISLGTVVPKLKGDVNADGLLNISDAVILQNYLVNNGTLTDPTAADVCEDGLINVFDLVAVKRLLIE